MNILIATYKSNVVLQNVKWLYGYSVTMRSVAKLSYGEYPISLTNIDSKYS